MVEHYIVSGSSYKKGTRIALHQSYIGGLDANCISKLMDELQKQDGLIYSVHYLVTEADGWDSVVSYDPYFEGMLVVDTVEEFVKLMKQDTRLKGIDIAKYLIAKYDICDHLKLEKMVYLCYADYLCSHMKRMYDDGVMAFDYGPVVDSVYSKFHHKSKLGKKYSAAATQSRIMVLEDGAEILHSIDQTILKFGDIESWDLVDLTHSSDSPWQKCYVSGGYRILIPDEIIKEYHKNEVLV